MRPHRNSALSAPLAAPTILAAALSIAATVQPWEFSAPEPRSAPPALQQLADRCPPGSHEVPAPNGNGYRCVGDGY